MADLTSTIPIQSTGDSLDQRRLKPLPADKRARLRRKQELAAGEEPEDVPTEQGDHELDVTA